MLCSVKSFHRKCIWDFKRLCKCILLCLHTSISPRFKGPPSSETWKNKILIHSAYVMFNCSNVKKNEQMSYGSSESPKHEISLHGRKQQLLCHWLWQLFFGSFLCRLLFQLLQDHPALLQLFLCLSCAKPHP